LIFNKNFDVDSIFMRTM